MIELGPRIGVSDTDTTQFTAGVRGDIGSSGWNYDVSAQYGRVSNFSGTKKDVSITRAQNALLAIAGPGGTPVCISGGACAPINLFTGNGARSRRRPSITSRRPTTRTSSTRPRTSRPACRARSRA
jgi:hypothetical protein